MPRPRPAVVGTLTLVTIVVLSGAAAIVLAATRGSRHPYTIQAQSISCPSPALGGTLPAQVYLPPDYSSAHRRYPVIYFLHGLPASPASYENNSFIAGALVTAHQPALVVAPQGARSANSDREYLDWSATENWPRAITHDLTSCIDRRYNTIAKRVGRALVGLSAGGYGALNIGLRNLKTFGAIESWSGYITATDPSGYHLLKLPTATAQQNSAVPDAAVLNAELARYPSLVAFYCGQADDRFADTTSSSTQR